MSSNESRKYTQIVDYINDQVGADLNRDLIQIAISAIDSGNISGALAANINEIGGQAQSAVDVADKIDQIEDTLASVGGDQQRVDIENYNAGNLPTDIQSWNAGALPVEQQTPVYVEADDDAGNTASIQGEELGTALGGTETAIITYLAQALAAIGNDQVRVDLQNNNAGTLSVQEQANILTDGDVQPVTGSTSSNGTNVTLVLGDYRKDVDLFVDISGSATLTVEIRVSGGTWREFDTISYNSSDTQVEQYSTTFAEFRARVDSNLNTLEASAKGV